jgi:predicted amidohydrolase
MKIAAAQVRPLDGNIEANLGEHYRLIELATENEVSLIVFPEMSVTGYQRESAEDLSFTENDSRLEKLKNLSVEKNIVIVAGAPIKLDGQLHIGEFIFQPNGKTEIYTKQFLHQGEDEFFTPSFDYNPLLELNGETISLAICADITNPIHPANAAQKNTSLYLASIFYTPNGISECYEQLSRYARKYSMNILMANYCGESYNWSAAGQSAFWSKNGEKVLQLSEDETGLLVIDWQAGNYTGKAIR